MDPLLLTAASTLVAWTTTELAQGGRTAVTALVDFLRDRFRPDPQARKAVEAVLQQPSPDTARLLAEELHRETLRDPAFGAEFVARWRQANAAIEASTGGVVNSISGEVRGPVVQARDIHGGVSFGDPR
ncbi:hypothetical protein [Plantactinospora sp. KBS50]|uniref:hypothetical protein n=1 Tax=Plantactinospora sp. KBS50 TaxID=2024580 RepID=UPI000BAAD715|nr:hypothetical protein [Plantactinospora sp. KBS50]ASW54416.1 hypothetical protein CIK06_09775 [Plantactinospora sp. KBS50]